MLPLIKQMFLVLLTVKYFPVEDVKTQAALNIEDIKNKVVQLLARLRPLVAAEGNILPIKSYHVRQQYEGLRIILEFNDCLYNLLYIVHTVHVD